MHAKAFFSGLRPPSRLMTVLLLVAAGSTATAWAVEVNAEQLQGNFELTALSIDYGGFPPNVDEDDFESLSGYFSATDEALVFEHIGQASTTFTRYSQFTGGLYELGVTTGNERKATVRNAAGNIVDDTLTLRMPSNDTLILKGRAFGSSLDSNGQTYLYTYEFSRKGDARPKAVIIPLFD